MHIYNFFLSLLLCFSLGCNISAKESQEQSSQTSVIEGEEDNNPEVSDDTDLDNSSYEDDDDSFVPTEEIPADEPIPFPTNI